jgi:hypothetical protein
VTGKQIQKGLLLTGALVLVSFVGVLLFSNSGADDAVDSSRNRIFICSETGKVFRQELKVGMDLPLISPFTGRATGIEAELCYWTASGEIKKEPTPVLLNERIGKPGPTFCPDCNRLVVGLNPPPRLDSKPPPKREEYSARRPKSRGSSK